MDLPRVRYDIFLEILDDVKIKGCQQGRSSQIR